VGCYNYNIVIIIISIIIIIAYPNSMRLRSRGLCYVVTDDDLGLPINTRGSYTSTRLDECPRGASQTRDLHTTITRAHTKLKIQTSNRLHETFYARFRTKLLSHNNPLITKHSVCVREYNIIYIYYIMYIASFRIRLYKHICYIIC